MLDHYRGKKVLITGHTGFKGAWLSQWLVNMGADVAGVSLNIPTQPSLFEQLDLMDEMGHFEADIRCEKSLENVFKQVRPEIVFHLAAQPIVNRSYVEPASTYATNLMGTVNVLECFRNSENSKLAVIITTDKVYENQEWNYGYRESDTLGGKDPYSASKACAEIALQSFHQSYFSDFKSKRILACRAGNVIGGGDWGEFRIVPDCVRAWSEGKKCELRNPHSTRPWQHVLEPLSGYLWLGVLAQSDPKLAGESFNLGPSDLKPKSVLDLVKELKKTWTAGDWDIQSSDSSKESKLLRLSCEKISHFAKWRACLSFEETVSLTGKWYKCFYDNGSKAEIKEVTNRQIEFYESIARDRKIPWAEF